MKAVCVYMCKGPGKQREKKSEDGLKIWIHMKLKW